MHDPRHAFTALVLAAGRSRRMGQPKALLLLDGETLVGRIRRIAAEAGAAAVIVVAGAEHSHDPELVTAEALAALLRTGAPTAEAPPLTLTTGAPDGESIDSIRAGLRVVDPTHHVLLWPVDHPFATTACIASLVAALGQAAGKIALPIARGRPGHPVLLGAEVARELLAPGLREGARTVVRRDPRRLVEVPCPDPLVTEDVDTPEQAARFGITLPR